MEVNAAKNPDDVNPESPRPAPPNCYKCKYRREIPGDAHSSCAHPIVGETDPFEAMMAMFASAGRTTPRISEMAIALNVNGSPHGIRRGWFNWPYNFDPRWLTSCDGFEAKGDAARDAGTSAAC